MKRNLPGTLGGKAAPPGESGAASEGASVGKAMLPGKTAPSGLAGGPGVAVGPAGGAEPAGGPMSPMCSASDSRRAPGQAPGSSRATAAERLHAGQRSAGKGHVARGSTAPLPGPPTRRGRRPACRRVRSATVRRPASPFPTPRLPAICTSFARSAFCCSLSPSSLATPGSTAQARLPRNSSVADARAAAEGNRIATPAAKTATDFTKKDECLRGAKVFNLALSDD